MRNENEKVRVKSINCGGDGEEWEMRDKCGCGEGVRDPHNFVRMGLVTGVMGITARE
jgi:hypothetical protein